MIKKPELSHQIKLVTVGIYSAKAEEWGSGVIYQSQTQQDKLFIITAKHCLCGKKFSHAARWGDITIKFFDDEKQHYFEKSLPVGSTLLYFIDERDIAVIIFDRVDAPFSTKDLPQLYLVDETKGIRNSAVFGFPNGSPNDSLERVDTILETVLKPID